MNSKPPEVSIVIPAFRSQRTIVGCLDSVAQQTFSNFETIVVDSSPTDSVQQIVTGQFPKIRYVHRRERLLPHHARNVGASMSRGRLLVFTDPDVYPEPDWVERLVGAHEESGAVVVGSVACFGRRWIDVGTHFCKYDMWLPGGKGRPISIAPTVNMVCSREIFERLGGFPGDLMLGDTVFSWHLAEVGERIWFEPNAIVHHHHLNSWSGLLRERYERGGEFGELRLQSQGWGVLRTGAILFASLLPIRLVKLLWRTAANASGAREMSAFVRALPVILSGQAAWLAGEAAAYGQGLLSRVHR